MSEARFEPQVRAWALEQAEMRSVKRFMVEAAGRVLAEDLEQAETCLELALQSLRAARRFHARWAGE